jgi:hypothetical protein
MTRLDVPKDPQCTTPGAPAKPLERCSTECLLDRWARCGSFLILSCTISADHEQALIAPPWPHSVTILGLTS